VTRVVCENIFEKSFVNVSFLINFAAKILCFNKQKFNSMNKQVFIEKSFARMQKIVYTTFCVVILLSWSCQNDNEQEPLSDEQISINLSKKGKNDPKLLIGEWDAVMFAYTANGKKISDVLKIERAYLFVTAAPTDTVCWVDDPVTGMSRQTKQWGLQNSHNSSNWLCSIHGNSIKFSLCFTNKMGVPCPHEENDIVGAFYYAYSFVVNKNELMIFFSRDEKNKIVAGSSIFGCTTSIAGEKKINIIIFKKR